MILNFFEEIVKQIIAWWKKIWVEARVKGYLDMVEFENRIEAELERERMNQPIYTEHPIDPELQTGESQKLGGAMQLTAPWYKDKDVEP